MDNEEEPQQERPRPKVVDKRISAQPAADDHGPAPSEQAAPPAPQPSSPPAADASAGTGSPEPDAAASSSPQERLAGDPDLWTPEQEAEARRLAQEVAQTPSLEWVVNVAVTLANVAGTKLDLGAPADAQLAIDALAALIEGLGPRLENAEAPLRQTLAQLQLAYAERAAPPPATPPP